MEPTIIKVFLPMAIAFVAGIALTPLITHYLYIYRAWKKTAGKGVGYGGGATPIFDELHKESDTNTPRMGGIVIWASVFITVGLLALMSLIVSETMIGKLNFVSRTQTWLPLATLIIGAFVGLIDDLLVVRGSGAHFAGGLPLSQRLLVVTAAAAFSGWWFFEKLDVTGINLPLYGFFDLGIFFIPFFIIVASAVYASSVIDGIDGLAGGVFMYIFMAYSAIAFYQEQYDLAALCATIVGGILAFLWFNIPPARFYMTETGIMALTMTLTIVAFMTDSLGGGEGVFVLPIIGSLLVLTVVSDVVQILSKKLRGTKVFIVAPIHHHFEAIGWPKAKVTMRYWVLGFISAVIGILCAIGF